MAISPCIKFHKNMISQLNMEKVNRIKVQKWQLNETGPEGPEWEGNQIEL